MKMILHYIIILLLVNLFCVPKQAYPLDITDDPNNKTELMLSGEIKQNDAEKLANYFVNTNLPKMIFIDSPGGNLVEAIRIAEIIELLQLSVSVTKGKSCLSSCFFIYLAGSGRTSAGAEDGMRNSLPVGYLGLHRPYLRLIDNTDKSRLAQTGVMKKVANYLENKLVPRRFIDLMMNRPSNDIYWLTTEDIVELGDYNPAQEELYISKCGYDRRLIDQIVKAKRSGNDALFSILKDKVRRTNLCIAALENDSFLNGIIKLKSGWRPPITILENDLPNKPTKQKITTLTPSSTEEDFKEIAKRSLAELYPNWEEIVTSKEFKKWVKSLPKADQTRLNDSWDPYYVAEKITSFNQRKIKR